MQSPIPSPASSRISFYMLSDQETSICLSEDFERLDEDINSNSTSSDNDSFHTQDEPRIIKEIAINDSSESNRLNDELTFKMMMDRIEELELALLRKEEIISKMSDNAKDKDREDKEEPSGVVDGFKITSMIQMIIERACQ